MLLPGKEPESLQVPANEVKTFKNGTLARNPFVPGANSLQLIYADLDHIIPVDENGKAITGAPTPIYNNDSSNPHKAAATAAPDLTSQGWVLQNPSQATINPVNPGADTKVVYVQVVTNTEKSTVKQTVHYQYADGTTAGRPQLPADNVQTLTFIHTVVTNPITGKVISETWSPAQQFTVVKTPTLAGYFPDQSEAGSTTPVDFNSADTNYVVKYYGPEESTLTKTVTQTIHYRYLDGDTTGRPTLPTDNVQALTFTGKIQCDPHTHEVISETWSPAQKFTRVRTPNITGFFYDRGEAGSTDEITHESPNLEYIVNYAAPTTHTREKVISQTVYYQYADGTTANRPQLPATNVQQLKFTETLGTNPFTGQIMSMGWDGPG